MGILMDFYAGDAKRIAEVENEPEGSDIELSSAPFVKAHADFSLHIVPDDLDVLMSALCARRGLPPKTLTGSLIEHLAGSTDPMEATSAADVVSTELVEMVASMQDSDIPPVAEAWLRQLGVEPTDDAEGAVGDLVRLCRVAHQENLAVVFSWSL